MKNRSRRSIRRGPGRLLLRWHRRIGVALSAIFIVICVTGILLNHSSDLALHKKLVDFDWVYDWYDMEPEGELLHFPLNQGSINHLDGTLYFDSTSIDRFDTPVGLAELDSFIAIASRAQVAILSQGGDLIEVLRSVSLPPGDINAIDTKDQATLILQTEQGVYRSDSDILTWQAYPGRVSLKQLSPTDAPSELREDILRAYRGEGLTWNRIILDLHSGRFFGPAGKWIADISALGLIILTISGIIYTLKYLKKARERSLSRTE